MTARALEHPLSVHSRRRFLSSLTICGIWSMAVAYLMMLITATIQFHAGDNSSMYLWYIVTGLIGLAAYFAPPGLVERKASKILFVLVLAGIMALVGFITVMIVVYLFAQTLFANWQNVGGLTAFGFYLSLGITATLFGALTGVGRAVLISMERRALVMGAITSAIGWALGSVFLVLWLEMSVVGGAGRFEMLFNQDATSFGLLLFLSTYALPWFLMENDIKKFPLKYLPREERIRERGRIATVSDRVQLFGIERFNKPKQAPDFPSLKEPDRNEGRVWWKLRATATEDGRALLLIALNGYMNAQTSQDFWRMLGNCIESGWDMIVIDLSCVKEWANVDMTFAWQTEADRRDARVLLSRPDRIVHDAVVNSNLPHSFGVVRKGQAAFDYFNREREGKIPVEVLSGDAGRPRLTIDAISSRAAPNAPTPEVPSPQVHAFRYFQWKAEPFRTGDQRPAVILSLRGKLRRHTGYEVNELLDLFGRAGWRLMVLNLTEAEEQAIVGVIHSFTDHLHDRGGVLILVGAMGPLLIPREGRDAIPISYTSDNLRAQQLLNQLCQSVPAASAPAPLRQAPLQMRVGPGHASALLPALHDPDGRTLAIDIADPAQFNDLFRPGGPYPPIQQITRDLGPNVSLTMRAERTPAQMPLAAIYVKGEMIAAYNYEITSQVKRMARAGWRAFNIVFKQRPSVQAQHAYFNLRRELERTGVTLVLTCTAEVKMQLDERLLRALPVNISRQLSGQEIDRTYGITYRPDEPAQTPAAPHSPVHETPTAQAVAGRAPADYVPLSATPTPQPDPAAQPVAGNEPEVAADPEVAAPSAAAAASDPAVENAAAPAPLPQTLADPVAPAAFAPPGDDSLDSGSANADAPGDAGGGADSAKPASANELAASAVAFSGGDAPHAQAHGVEPTAPAAPAVAAAAEWSAAPTEEMPTAEPMTDDAGTEQPSQPEAAEVVLAPPAADPAASRDVPEAPAQREPPRAASPAASTPPGARVARSSRPVPTGRPQRADGLPVHDNKGGQFQMRAERQPGPQGGVVVLHVGGAITRDRGDSLFHLRTSFEALAAEHFGRVVMDCSELKTLHEGVWLADQRAHFRALGPGCDLILCNLPRRLQVVCGMAKWDRKLKIVETIEEARRELGA
ncbi:MAG: hypothetical protein ACREJ2_08200 [Planctomycetota bacterium]